MPELYVVARLVIHEGKLEAFKAAATECMRGVREKDSGTLQYDWHFTPDMGECVVFERYRDSDAVLEHLGNIGEALGSMLAVSDLSLDVFGEPSAALLAASAGMAITVHSPFMIL